MCFFILLHKAVHEIPVQDNLTIYIEVCFHINRPLIWGELVMILVSHLIMNYSLILEVLLIVNKFVNPSDLTCFSVAVNSHDCQSYVCPHNLSDTKKLKLQLKGISYFNFHFISLAHPSVTAMLLPDGHALGGI